MPTRNSRSATPISWVFPATPCNMHEEFCSKQSFPFDLLSDADETLCRQFDVIREKNLYGRKVHGH